jgi:hypothetical protein
VLTRRRWIDRPDQLTVSAEDNLTPSNTMDAGAGR